MAFRVHNASNSASGGFSASRLRFAAKLETTVRDDQRANRYYLRDAIAPRFFQASLDDYVRAVSARDWEAAKKSFKAMKHFGKRRRHLPGWKLAVIRGPRIFRWILRVHEHLPHRLRLTRAQPCGCADHSETEPLPFVRTCRRT